MAGCISILSSAFQGQRHKEFLPERQGFTSKNKIEIFRVLPKSAIVTPHGHAAAAAACACGRRRFETSDVWSLTQTMLMMMLIDLP